MCGSEFSAYCTHDHTYSNNFKKKCTKTFTSFFVKYKNVKKAANTIKNFKFHTSLHITPAKACYSQICA